MPTYYILDDDNNIINSIIADEETVQFVEGRVVNQAQLDEIIPPLDLPPAPEPTPAPRVWTQDNVRSALTLAEKTKWDNDSAPEVVTAKIEISGGLELAAITEVLDFLVEANVISADSKTAVLA